MVFPLLKSDFFYFLLYTLEIYWFSSSPNNGIQNSQAHVTLGAWPLTLRAYLASLTVSGQRWRKATCGDELRPCTHFCARSLFHAPVSHWRLMMLADHPSRELVLILEHWALSVAKSTVLGFHTMCVLLPHATGGPFIQWCYFVFQCVPGTQHGASPPGYMCVCVCVCVCVFQPLFIEWVNGVKC